MQWFDLMRDAGAFGGAAFLLGLVGALCSVIVGIVLALKRPASPMIALVPVGLLPWVGILAHTLGRRQALFAMAAAAPEMKQTLAAAGISTRIGGLSTVGLALGVVALLGCMLAMGAAFRQEKRALGLGAVALVIGLVCGGLALVGIATGVAPASAAVQVGLLILPVLTTSFAMTGTDRAGRLAATLAATLLALAVAGGHAYALSTTLATGFHAVAVAPPDMKQAILATQVQEIQVSAALALVPTLLAMSLPLLAASRVTEPRDRPMALLSASLSAGGLILVVICGYPFISLLVSA